MEELYEELNVKSEIFLPIRKIDGMLVNVRMYTHDNHFYFEASLINGTYYTDKGYSYEEFCRMIDGLKDMKFDNFLGKFTNPSKITPPYYSDKKEMPMFHHPNIEMDYTECCVCFELTISKTTCFHPLCLRCYSKIKTNHCPLCRENI
jgi:hypothetical protein